jgi:hypothetical protein
MIYVRIVLVDMDNIYGRGSVEFSEELGGSNNGSPIRKEDSSGHVSNRPQK